MTILRFQPPLGEGFQATYAVHFTLIGKSAFSKGVGQLGLTFQVKGEVSLKPFFVSEN